MKYNIFSLLTRPAAIIAFGCLVLFFPIVLVEVNVLSYTNGIFIYALDDTYIHLNLAQHLANGTWGINDNEFAGASSSLLYTALLSISHFFFDSPVVPFIFNCITGVFIVYALYSWLSRQNISPVVQLIIIPVVIFTSSLALLIVSGMEHSLQCLFSFLFIFGFSEWLENNAANVKSVLPARLYILSFLVGSIRYEGLFLICIAGLFLLVHKKIKIALLVLLIGSLPVILFGAYSLYKGGFFLPNSVMIKSTSTDPNLLDWLSTIMVNKFIYAKTGIAEIATQRLLILLPLFYIFFKRFIKPSETYILFFLFGALVCQITFTPVGWPGRYEAYLFFGATLICACLTYRYGKEVFTAPTIKEKTSLFLIFFFLLLPVVTKSTASYSKLPQACKNIYEQQYMMASFVKRYYNQQTVALNDIGAVGYFTDATIIDLWGLADTDISALKYEKRLTPAYLDSICKKKGAKIAVIYDSWFNNEMQGYWKKVASWQIQENVICGDDTVSFYSILPENGAGLAIELKEFEKSLPRSVVVKYY
jgi:hypothetical protein